MQNATFVGPGWEHDGAVSARGRAFEGRRPVDVATAFARADTFEDVVETARRLDGFFAAVVTGREEQYLVCDHARSIPLYFSTRAPLRIGDNAACAAVRRDSTQFDPVAESEFALTRYVTRGETLLPTVRSVRAGEVVRVPHGEPAAYERHRYYRYRPTTQVRGDRKQLVKRMERVLDQVFDRVVDVAQGRTVVVPLSGGWDSRLVATMLVERGLDVVGFTFGVPGHADVEVSRDVADALGIRWEWVAYSTDRWHDWYHAPDRQAYHDFAFSFDSLPFLAEWPAVRELVADGKIPADSLICPGHTVATPSERVPATWASQTPTRSAVVDAILDTHYTLWEWDDPAFRREFAGRITADASLGNSSSGAEAAAAYEEWEWTTRMATFTNGDARLYDWFDLDWWFPLWDPAYVRFWERVPLSHRRGKSLQIAYTERIFADVAGVEPEVARLTDRDWTPFDQLRRTFRTNPKAPFEDGFDAWLGVQAVPRDRWESWGNYPLGWYGIVPEESFDDFSSAPNLYSLRTLEALGLLLFDPPRVDGFPSNGRLSLPPSGGRKD